MKTDWFELRQARLHLAPYTEPRFPIAVASTITPSGVVTAGKHGLGVLSLGAGLPGGPEMLANQWKIAEETAASHGKTMDRRDWKLVVNVHVADDDEEALRQVFERIYEDTERYWREYSLCEDLVDLETQFQTWRFRHMRTVMRIIGFKRGTGGSSGVGVLR